MSTDATTSGTTSHSATAPAPAAPAPAAAAQAAAPTSAVIDAAKLPDDPAVLKQMIVELILARRQDRRQLAELQQRLDALLQRGRRQDEVDPNQPLLFPDMAQAETPVPPPTTAEEPRRRGKNQSHGRRRPAHTCVVKSAAL